MNLLVTGDRGRLGRFVCERLVRDGHTLRGFDAQDGDDVRNARAVSDAAAGAEALVHLAGLPDDLGAEPAEVMAVNLLGTWNVLLAAREQGCARVVFFSSGKALGMLEREPAQVPIDDDHPGLPSRPYGLAKWLAEEMCEAFTRDTGIATICLRPVAVVMPGESGRPPAGMWVDVRDVAEAAAAALERPREGHVRLLLAAGDGAIVDASRARRVLGWEPRWRGVTREEVRQ